MRKYCRFLKVLHKYTAGGEGCKGVKTAVKLYFSPYKSKAGSLVSVYLLVDEVNGTSRVDVHKVNVGVVVDELGNPRHGVWEAALHLETQIGN